MARKSNQQTQQFLNLFVQWFRALHWKVQLGVGGLLVILVGGYLLYVRGRFATDPLPLPPGPSGPPSAALLERTEFLFCWWNVENFFDDKIDGWKQDADQEYDEWFAANPDLLRLKVANLTAALLQLNGGIGPDILACCEIEESPNAQMPGSLVLLRDSLNAGIADPGLHYREVLWKHMPTGRNIINAILTRLPVDASETRLVYRNERILQGVIQVRGHDLHVLASHWTSRLTDKTGERRADYGDAIYNHFRKLEASNPDVSFLVAGDFNDPPEAPSVVQHLHASGDLARVRTSRDLLFNLMSSPSLIGKGTIADGAKLATFDQLVVSPGMLREKGTGWTVDPESIGIVTAKTTYKKRGNPLLFPLRFGSKSQQGERGCSDHLPVVVTLHLPR